MKQNRKLQQWCLPALIGAALAFSTSVSLAVGDFILNTFDSAAELTASGNAWAGGTATWDGAVDAGGAAGTGSMHVVCPFTNMTNDWQEVQISRDIPWPYIDLSPYAYFECDIKPDVANSFPAFDGNWATYQLIIQQWDWTPLAEQHIVGNGWTHVKVLLSPATTLAHLIMDFHTTWMAYPTNTISYWIDNIKLTVPPQAPMPVLIQPSGPGVEIDGTVINAGNSQRQYIRTFGNDYTWAGSITPVTYSMTIKEVPSAVTNIPEVDLLLVGNSPNPGGDADWNEANVIYLQLGWDGNTTTPGYNGQLFFKTNLPSGNSQYFASGHRPVAIYHTPKYVGTWSVMFGTNGEVVLTAPNGTTSSNLFPADAVAYFNTTVVPYIGIQPAGHHYPAVLFSHFAATGVPTPLDDSFANLDNWIKVADNNLGIVVHPTDTVYQLSWLGPAAGFKLEQSSDLLGTWSDSVVAGVTAPVLLGDYKKSWVPASAMPAPSQGFWRLKKIP